MADVGTGFRCSSMGIRHNGLHGFGLVLPVRIVTEQQRVEVSMSIYDGWPRWLRDVAKQSPPEANKKAYHLWLPSMHDHKVEIIE